MKSIFLVLFLFTGARTSQAMSIRRLPPCTAEQLKYWDQISTAYKINQYTRITTTIGSTFLHLGSFDTTDKEKSQGHRDEDGFDERGAWMNGYSLIYLMMVFSGRDCHSVQPENLAETEQELKAYAREYGSFLLVIQGIALTNSRNSENRKSIAALILIDLLNEAYFQYFWHPTFSQDVALVPYIDQDVTGAAIRWRF